MYRYLYYGMGAYSVATLVTLILSIIGGVIVYFVFVARKDMEDAPGFGGWLHSFLNFRTLFAEPLLKALYCISAISITLGALSFLLFMEYVPFGFRFLIFLGILILGNALIRLLYEFSLVRLIVCRNTTEINKKLSGSVRGSGAKANASQPSGIPGGIVVCSSCNNSFSDTEAVCPYCGKAHR